MNQRADVKSASEPSRRTPVEAWRRAPVGLDRSPVALPSS